MKFFEQLVDDLRSQGTRGTTDTQGLELVEKYDLEINNNITSTVRQLLDESQSILSPSLLLSTKRSLDAWPDDDEREVEEKINDFQLHVLRRYDLVITIHGFDKPEAIGAEHIRAANLTRLAGYLQKLDRDPDKRRRVGDLKARQAQMHADIESVYLLFQTLLPDNLRALVATRQAFLQSLSCLFLAGRMQHDKLLNEITNLRDTADMTVEERAALALCQQLAEMGTYIFEDNTNKLVGPGYTGSAGENLWRIRANLRAYKLGRDFARWLVSGAFDWSRDEMRKSNDKIPKPEKKEPIKHPRILFIDPLLDLQFEDKSPVYRLRDRLQMIFATLFGGHEGPVTLDFITAPNGLFPDPVQWPGDETERLGDSVVAFDRFLATGLKKRIHRVTLEALAPGKGFPPLDENGRRYQDWGMQPIGDGGWSLWDYHAIFCEVAHNNLYAGPQVVQKLRSYFERTSRPGRRADELFHKAQTGTLTSDEIIKWDRMPAIIVLTRDANFDMTHQCLNLGAHAFVSKDRLFQIPARLWSAVRDEEGAALHRAQTYKAGARNERLGHRSNFRNLYSLRAERMAFLQRTSDVYGISGKEGDRAWIKRLPKADLHRHLGTSIRLKTIEALAFNSVGHMMADYSTAGAAGGGAMDVLAGSHLDDVITLTFRALLICAVHRAGFKFKYLTKDGAENVTEAQLLLGAASWMCGQYREQAQAGKTGGQWYPGRPIEKYWQSKKPLDDLVELLAPVGSPVRLYQAASLIVAATRLLRTRRPGAAGELDAEWVQREMKSRWRYLQDIDKWESICERVFAGETFWFDAFIAPTARSCQEQVMGMPSAPSPPKIPAGQPRAVYQTRGYFATLHRDVSKRIDVAVTGLGQKFQEAKAFVETLIDDELAGGEAVVPVKTGAELVLEALPRLPSLGELVINRTAKFGGVEFPRKLGLLRYLWGCGLLGADHLQFPENLILAAQDLVAQNADECVIYSEVRCETPGYTVAGMSAAGATGLLQKSFDLASAFFRETGGRPGEPESYEKNSKSGSLQSPDGASFIRTNILLAAKRHKNREICATVVGLLERYLSIGPRTLDYEPDTSVVPKWWKPCSVVGFDLSGNEEVDTASLEHEIKRLFQYNSPITIHAGEAATAESIWQAVYQMHARRIGHGLRLRESPHLLRYCIDEGICMEMCPISNYLTHGFIEVIDEKSYLGLAQEHYPLRYYMAAGLEVCINTDNLSLHQPMNQIAFDPDGEGATITDEYLMAARLSGGFSRWEVLKLVRAGFKHAFLPKVDISDLLSATENRVYTLVAHDPGVDWRAPAWSPREDN